MVALVASGAAVVPATDLAAQTALSGEPIRIGRLDTPIHLDGRLDELEWSRASRISRMANVGMNMDTRFNGFFQLRLLDDQVRSGAEVFHVHRVGYVLRSSPSRRLTSVAVDGVVGEEVDFANSRLGRGSTINLSARLNPTNHLELDFVRNVRWLNVDADAGRGRLFTARVSRVRGTYTFTARSFVRVIAQYVSTEREPSLFVSTVPARSGTFLGSLLFAYKLNWQSVMFVGYGDDRELSTEERLERAGHRCS